MSRIGSRFCATLLCLALPGLTAMAREVVPSAQPGTAPVAAAAQDKVVRVTDAAGLAAALGAATGGETIRLAPGEYGKLDLDGGGGRAFSFEPPVTVTSDDPGAPAVFTAAQVHGVTGMIFDGLIFDYRAAPGDSTSRRMFQFTGCRDLTIRNSLFDGDLAQGVSELDDGNATGFGLIVGKSTNVIVSGNEIRLFQKGMGTGANDNIAILGNTIHSLRRDAITVTGTQGIRIEGNHIHGFLRARGSKDHSDMIQFWTNGSKRPSTDIVIRGNLLQAGDGGTTQSIFMRNDLVDKGKAGPEMFYRRVTIEDNVILNGHLHGITLGESDGVVIRRNTLLRDPAFSPGEAKRIPRIKVKGRSVGVVVEDNIAFKLPSPQPGWRIAGNLIAQDMSPAEPNFYAALFMPRPPGSAAGLAALTTLMVRPGGPAARSGLGSGLMR